MLADQQELTYNSSVRTQDVVWKNCQEQWMIGTDGERESGKSVPAAWLPADDDDDEILPVLLTQRTILSVTSLLDTRLMITNTTAQLN